MIESTNERKLRPRQIRLTRNLLIQGKHTPAGTILTLEGRLAADFVYDKCAVFCDDVAAAAAAESTSKAKRP